MSHREITQEQRQQRHTFKRAINGDGDAVEQVFATTPPVAFPGLTEQYYKASTPGDTASDSYVEIDGNDFTVAAGDYWLDVSAQFGGDKKKNFGVRIKVDGNVIGELTWKGAEESDSRSMSLIEELNGKTAGTLNVSLEAKCDDGGADKVFIEQWAVRLRKK